MGVLLAAPCFGEEGDRPWFMQLHIAQCSR